MIEYKILYADTMIALEHQVNELLKSGWSVIGGVAAVSKLGTDGLPITWYLQAVGLR